MPLRTLYQFFGSLTRPVRYCLGTGSHTLKVSTPWLPPGVLQSAANLSKLRSEAEGVYCVGCCRRMVSTAPVGADRIRPKPRISGSTRMDGATPCRGRQAVDPAHKHPERALCAAGGFYPPLQSDGEAAGLHPTALFPQLRADSIRPYRACANRFCVQCVTGWVRTPTYSYKRRRVTKKT